MRASTWFAVLAFALSGCSSPASHYRYKLTLHLDDDGKSVEASDVVEVAQQTVQTFDEGNLLRSWSTGQAVFFDFGSRGVLLVLLGGPGLVESPSRVVWNSNPTLIIGEAGARDGKIRLQPEQLPLFVKFSDPSDPRTGSAVDPRDLESAFGPNVHFKDATIELTNEPVTTGLDKRLPWLAKDDGLSIAVKAPGRSLPVLRSEFFSGTR